MDVHWQRCLTSFLRRTYDRSGSQSSLDRYSRVLARFFADPARNPDSYSQSEVESFITQPSESTRNKGQAVSVATKNQRLAILASFYRFASTYSVEGDGPVYLLQRPAPTTGLTYGKPRYDPYVLTYDEVSRLFAAIPDDLRGKRDRAVLMCYFWSARRRAEIMRLRRGDFSQITFPDGNSYRRGWQYRYTAKGTGAQVSYAEMPEPAMVTLLDYITASGRRWETMTADEPIFLSLPPPRGGNYRNSGKMLSGHSANLQLKYYARLIGIDEKRVTLHVLRHTSSRMRYEAGSDIRSIQRLLGHASLATTNHYLRSLVPQGDEGARLLEKRLRDLDKS